MIITIIKYAWQLCFKTQTSKASNHPGLYKTSRQKYLHILMIDNPQKGVKCLKRGGQPPRWERSEQRNAIVMERSCRFAAVERNEYSVCRHCVCNGAELPLCGSRAQCNTEWMHGGGAGKRGYAKCYILILRCSCLFTVFLARFTRQNYCGTTIPQ